MTNLLSLEDWRRIVGLHPYYFWGLTTGEVEPRYPNNTPASVCMAFVKKYAWQGADYLGRADIEQAIETSEKKLRDYLGFSIAPEYKEDTVLWPRYYDTVNTRYANWDTSGRFISVSLPYGGGYVQALGIESLTLIGTVATGAPGGLVFSDADSDGLLDTFTITIATSQTDPDKLAVYFAAADRLDSEAISERWRIRPVKVSISAGVATIIGRVWLLAKPIKYEGVLSQPLAPTAANFVDSLLVYNRTTDPTGATLATAQANVIWETEPCHGWWCCCSGCGGSGPSYILDSSTDAASYGVAMARSGIRDARMGRVTVGEALYNASTGYWQGMGWGACREPDRALIRHYSGYPLENGNVAQKWQTVVARLACAEMTKPICACEPANKLVHEWGFDMARVGGANEERFNISEADLSNPFGSKRGQIFAWQAVRNLRLTPGVIDH